MPRYRTHLIAAAMFSLGALVSPGTLAARAETIDLASCQPAAPTPAGDPVTVKGSGKTQTRPFSLDGGAYTVTWDVGQSSEYASYAIRIVPVVDEPFHHAQTVMSAVYTKNPDSSGETHVYDIKAGKYYLAVEAPKGWRVTFTPLPI